MTSMGKFLTITLLDGTLMVYESITGVTWRSEKVDGKHSGVGIALTNYLMELSREGQEHKMMGFIERYRDRLQKEFYDARGLPEYNPERETQPLY